MSRFWMVQHIMWWVTLMLNVVLHWPWFQFAVAALMLLWTGVEFGRRCQQDDERAASKGSVQYYVGRVVP